MNIEMFAVNVAVVSLIFVPYFLLIYLGQREFRKIDNLFKEEARKLGLNIEVKDRWNQNAIGIDTTQRKLLFIQKRNEDYFVQQINLSSVAHCAISHQQGNFKNNGVNEQFLQKIQLDFTDYDGFIISLCLFDYEYSFEQDYEMKHAEQWKKNIDSCLAPKQRKPLAA